ncbi:hypothetical protein [Micromonospora sonneratiae]|uniref:Uncharacterized protein n=1 Tax=Micromonospora sonneratiae TaxID=1184706 RepID=A0ABW3YKC7_9ACTN
MAHLTSSTIRLRLLRAWEALDIPDLPAARKLAADESVPDMVRRRIWLRG